MENGTAKGEIVSEETLEKRNYAELDNALSMADYTVYKRYLSDLNQYAVITPNQLMLDEEAKDCIRALQLTKLSSKKGEDILQKLSTIYSSCMELGCALFVLIDAKHQDSSVDFYLGIRNSEYENRLKNLSNSFNALVKGIESQFPGSTYKKLSATSTLPEKLEDIFSDRVKYISSVSMVASLRNKEKTEEKNFIQGIEKLISGMRGPYTALMIAEPITTQTRGMIRKGYEDLYTSISPFKKSVWSYHENQSTAVMESLSTGISNAVTEGVSHTQSHTVSKTKGTTNTVNIGGNFSSFGSNSLTVGKTSPTKVAKAGQVASTLGTVLKIAAPVLAATPIGPIVGSASMIFTSAGGVMQGASISESSSQTLGKSLGITGGLAHSVTRSETISDGTSETKSKSETNTETLTQTNAETRTSGTGRTLQIENTNKTIEEILKCIERHLERLDELEDYGAYNCGVYFLSGKQENTILAANTYQALMRGEGTGIETSAVNCWSDPDIVSTMKEYLKRIEQPMFGLPFVTEDGSVVDYIAYSAGTIVSGLELPLHLGLPVKSVEGLPVIEHAEFGRNILDCDNGIVIGKLSNMGIIKDEGKNVELDIQSLASHTFITGSTGTGKSNAVYQILSELNKKGIKFLVVEPAKGEYKNIFGGKASVYGTNPKQTEMLRMNPFSFPENILVLEHIDRLVEIFNACWPMYAAMPAILKEAIERSYENVGWNLELSFCEPKCFPTFIDLQETLKEVIEESSYSTDTKNDYIGALCTRVKSLSGGLNGQILCVQNEISYQDMFEENVIIDLSRIGSVETKALFMGLIVMRLQEYRQHLSDSNHGSMNVDLTHVTVLEEAHNLLRRTAFNQSQETSNLQGKSVEMITNSIAEMRTYGEGFIIADQAPELLDEAVIRNTNTKIVLRLPEGKDRELVGKAMALTKEQTMELAKLPRGIAAVYQNDWIEAVLCGFEKYTDIQPLEFKEKQLVSKIEKYFEVICGLKKVNELRDEEVDSAKSWIYNLRRSEYTKKLLFEILDGGILSEIEVQKLLYNVFEGKKLAQILLNATTEKGGIERVDLGIKSFIGTNNEQMIEIIRNHIIGIILTDRRGGELVERYGNFLDIRRRLV